MLGRPAARPKRRAQESLVPGKSALHLPTLAINSLEETNLHLTAIAGLGPSSATSTIQRDDRRTNAKFFAGENVVVLGIVGRIAHEPIKVNVPTGLAHRARELRRILAGAQTHESSGHEMALPMTNDGQLGPLGSAESLVSPTPHVVPADVTALQTRRIDDPLGSLADQIELSSASEQSLLKNDEGLFFRRRSSA